MLAAAVQIPVVSLHLRQLGANRLTIVERYDRIPDNGGHRRLHQEDFCQALGINAANKYEKEGGPSLRDCAMIVRRHTAFPLLEIQKLLQWTLFNWMVGNADAHGKNLSLLYAADGSIQLAPFYDLVCTRNYKVLARDLAMGIGGTFNPDFIGKPQLAALASDFAVQPRIVLEVFDQLLDAIPQSLDGVVTEWRSCYGSSPILQRLPLVIRKQIRRIKTHWGMTSM
jgi:serine/threonine-protein kinase HipA